MKNKNWRSALKVDFSENSTLKETLLADLMQRPDAPLDMKEDASMKKTIKYSTRVLICALIAVLLISGVAIATMTTLSLGPFATYSQPDDVALREASDDEKALTGSNVRTDRFGTTRMYFDTLEAVRPYLNPLLDPKLPTALPDGFALDSYSIYTDDEGIPYPESEVLTIFYTKQDKTLELGLQLMNENNAFEDTSAAPKTELTINGRSAISQGGALSMLVGDVLYEFSPLDSGLAVDELIKMAESIQG